jgi:DNA replicative helicase MCM subunit Mcm2 (Cdc46/Mcm family)
MIRLSVAHAKMRLSKSVDVEDAAVAIEIMRFIVESEGLAASNNKNMDKDSAPCADMNKNQNGICIEYNMDISEISNKIKYHLYTPEIALMVSLNEVDHSKISLFQKRLHE